MGIELARKPAGIASGGEFPNTGELAFRMGDGKSFSLDGSYTNNSTSNHILKVSRSGYAVQAAIGYTDSPIAMYIGTTTNHPFHFRTNNTTIGSVNANGEWTLGAAAGSLGTVARITNTQLLLGVDDVDSNGNFLQIARRSSVTKSAYIVAGIGLECGLEFLARNAGNTAYTAGKFDSAGAWTIGAAAGSQLHQINGNARFETSGSVSQAVIIRCGASAANNDLQFYNANSVSNAARNRIFAEIVAAQDSGTTPVFQYFVGRDSNAAITTRPLFSWVNFTTERGRVDADGTWRNTAGTWSTLSDSRLKQNVQNLSGALDLISSLRPVSFDWINADAHDISPRVSFIAQEIAEINPRWVSDTPVDGADGALVEGKAKQLTFGYDMQAYLVGAIKELKAQFDAYVASHP